MGKFFWYCNSIYVYLDIILQGVESILSLKVEHRIHITYITRNTILFFLPEAVVRANAFSVMVSVLMIKPQVPELQDILLRFKTPAPATLVSPPEVTPPSLLEEELPGEEEELVDNENEEAESKLEKKMAMMNWVVIFLFYVFLISSI